MAAFCSQPKRCVFWDTVGYVEATEGQEDCIGYGYAVEAPALLNRQCNRVQGWRRFFFSGKVDVKKKPKLPKVPLWNWGVIPAAFQYFLVEDARFSQRKLLMSLKWLVFVGIPNSVCSSRAKGIFGEPRHLPLARYDWKGWNSQNLDFRRWHRTMWQCVVLNSWATKNLWSVSIQSLCWYQRREFCAFFVKQFHFGLTYKNKILSVRLGR